jgi:hypothetical protein
MQPKTQNRASATVIAAAALLISVAGTGLASYITIRSDIERTVSRLNEHELRLNGLDRSLGDEHKAIADYQAEMRSAVAHAVDLLTDLRLQVARGAKR